MADYNSSYTGAEIDAAVAKALAAQAGALIPISKITASNDATIDIELTGSYSAFLVRLERIIPATDGGFQLEIRTSTDGVLYDNGGSDYGFAYQGYGTTGIQLDSQSSDSIRIGNQLGNDTGEDLNGEVRIFPADGTSYTTIQAHTVCTNFSAAAMIMHTGGTRYSATAVTHIQFIMASGNITSGVFHLYGIADGG